MIAAVVLSRRQSENYLIEPLKTQARLLITKLKITRRIFVKV